MLPKALNSKILTTMDTYSLFGPHHNCSGCLEMFQPQRHRCNFPRLKLAINFLRAFLGKWLSFTANFLTTHLLDLKRNLLVIGIQYIFICWILCAYNFVQTKNCFTVFPKRQKTIITLLKVAMLNPKPGFPVRITCWCSYQAFPVFQTITSSFSEGTPLFSVCGYAG